MGPKYDEDIGIEALLLAYGLGTRAKKELQQAIKDETAARDKADTDIKKQIEDISGQIEGFDERIEELGGLINQFEVVSDADFNAMLDQYYPGT